MIRLVFKMTFTAIIIGAIFTFILFLSIGDDNYLGAFAIIGLLVGALLAYLLKNKHIPRVWAITFISLFSFIALLLIIYGVFGFIFDKDIITGHTYYEMGGIMPYLAIGVSLPLALTSITISLYLKKKKLKDSDNH